MTDRKNRPITIEDVVDEILADARTQVLQMLQILCSGPGPDIDLAFEGCQSNAEAAVKMYRGRSIPHFRLRDCVRDTVLALACLQLGVPSRMTPEEQNELFGVEQSSLKEKSLNRDEGKAMGGDCLPIQ